MEEGCIWRQEWTRLQQDTTVDQRLLSDLMSCTLVSENQIALLCMKATELFSSEPNVKRVSCPVTVVGDLHGQVGDFKAFVLCKFDALLLP
jgi:hypothetical protein